MASSGFKEPPSSGKHEMKTQRAEKDDEVMSILQGITGDSASAQKATEGVDMSEVMKPQVGIPHDAKLNQERLQTLAECYEAESALSRAMLAFAGDLHASRQSSKGEQMYLALRKAAIQEMLAKTTRESTQALNLIAIVDNRLPAFAVTVFDEIFQSQPNPNVAEIEFLAHFTGCDSPVIRRWFTSKRARLFNLFNNKKFLTEFGRDSGEKMLEMLVKDKAAQDGKGF